MWNILLDKFFPWYEAQHHLFDNENNVLRLKIEFWDMITELLLIAENDNWLYIEQLWEQLYPKYFIKTPEFNNNENIFIQHQQFPLSRYIFERGKTSFEYFFHDVKIDWSQKPELRTSDEAHEWRKINRDNPYSNWGYRWQRFNKLESTFMEPKILLWNSQSQAKSMLYLAQQLYNILKKA